MFELCALELGKASLALIIHVIETPLVTKGCVAGDLAPLPEKCVSLFLS